jgi:penicillin amidase/acyl-homoserine-lactone acylase
MLRLFTVSALVIAVVSAIAGCSQPDRSEWLALADRYEVTIKRDIRGVPHIHGRTNADTAFGFAYAQAEDNWATIEESMPLYRGQMASIAGPDAAVTDYLIKLLRIWPTLRERYDQDLSEEMRSYLQAFADGLNYYTARHPDKVSQDLGAVTPEDIVAGHMLRHLLFFGFDRAVRELTADERAREISRYEVAFNDLPVGSNAFAVAPNYSSDGATRLAINSHQPTTGPVAWYEAHISSDEGLNVMGGVFPGSPSIALGFNETLGWAATVNQPDLFDVYVLEINPDDPDQYLLDGEWRDLEVSSVDIDVKLWGLIPWRVSQQVVYSAHGPVLRTDHGSYAFRYPGMTEIRQVEQWYRMNFADSVEEWREVMRMQSFASFNFVAADRDGNIMFVHNSLTPVRKAGYNWEQYLPGSDSSLIWQETMAFDDLPAVINPESGWVLSANHTPFKVTGSADNPDPASYPDSAGFDARMSNRAIRGLELFEALGPISAADFSAIKHDKRYAAASPPAGHVQMALALDYSGHLDLQAAQQTLASWDLNTDIDNTSAALGVCLVSSRAVINADPISDELIAAEFERCVALLNETFGRVDPPWGEVNRHIRGDVNVPVGGGPDTLRAIYGRGLEEDGFLTNVAGDGLYYLVSWDHNGRQQILGTHHFGSATLDAQSPHYSDQAVGFANETLHDPLFDADKLNANLSRTYSP